MSIVRVWCFKCGAATMAEARVAYTIGAACVRCNGRIRTTGKPVVRPRGFSVVQLGLAGATVAGLLIWGLVHLFSPLPSRAVVANTAAPLADPPEASPVAPITTGQAVLPPAVPVSQQEPPPAQSTAVTAAVAISSATPAPNPGPLASPGFPDVSAALPGAGGPRVVVLDKEKTGESFDAWVSADSTDDAPERCILATGSKEAEFVVRVGPDVTFQSLSIRVVSPSGTVPLGGGLVISKEEQSSGRTTYTLCRSCPGATFEDGPYRMFVLLDDTPVAFVNWSVGARATSGPRVASVPAVADCEPEVVVLPAAAPQAPPLDSWTDVTSPDSSVRFRVASDLLQSKDPLALEHLLPLARDPVWHVRRCVLKGLREFRSPLSVEVLIDALADRDAAAREIAWESLEHLVGRPLPFEVYDDEAARATAVARWQEWWLRNKASPPFRGSSDHTGTRAKPMPVADSAPVERPRPRPDARVVPARAAVLPKYSGELRGDQLVEIRNPNGFEVRVGLRSAGRGKDFVVPAGGVAGERVAVGKYKIYFIYGNEPGALLQGDDFSLKPNSRVSITLVQAADGNYGIRPVK